MPRARGCSCRWRRRSFLSSTSLSGWCDGSSWPLSAASSLGTLRLVHQWTSRVAARYTRCAFATRSAPVSTERRSLDHGDAGRGRRLLLTERFVLREERCRVGGCADHGKIDRGMPFEHRSAGKTSDQIFLAQRHCGRDSRRAGREIADLKVISRTSTQHFSKAAR